MSQKRTSTEPVAQKRTRNEPVPNQKRTSKFRNYERKSKYECVACGYITYKKANYTRHNNSKKHLKICGGMTAEYEQKHVIKIPIDEKGEEIEKETETEIEKLVKENAKLKEKLLEKDEKHKSELQEKEIESLKEQVKIYQKYEGKGGTSNSHNTTNSHNTNNISINMYINEHCKDAMNLDDFVNKIKFKLKDVFDGSLPIQNSVQKVFIKNLEDLDPTKRPVHCTDTRRGKFLVNDKNEGWVKDDGEKIASSVQKVQQKAIVESYDAFDAEYTPPHPGRIQDKKDSIINPLRNNREKARPKIVKEVANVVNIKDAINQLESGVKDID